MDILEKYKVVEGCLSEIGIRFNRGTNSFGNPYLWVNRDDMVNTFRSTDIPEGKFGAYNQTLCYLTLALPGTLMSWNGKTDDVLFLEIL